MKTRFISIVLMITLVTALFTACPLALLTGEPSVMGLSQEDEIFLRRPLYFFTKRRY